MQLRTRSSLTVLALAALGSVAAAFAQSEPKALTVFAASDLGPALERLVPLFEKTANAKVTMVLGSSGTMAQQIRNGAPADVFFSANERFIDDLAGDTAILPNTRVRYARGRIVTVTLKANAERISSLRDLAEPRVRRVAIANPGHAPYGEAARQALEATGLWKVVEPKLVYAENVQQTIQFVRSGSADAAIAARSIVELPDLAWTLIDADLHAPITQMAAVVSRTKDRALASAFLTFINGQQGRAVLAQFGFLPPASRN